MTGEAKKDKDLELVVLLLVVVVLIIIILAGALLALDLLPRLLGHLVGVLLVVSHEDVVEDRAAVDRPELEADGRKVLVLGVRLGRVVLVRDHRVLPGAL